MKDAVYGFTKDGAVGGTTDPNCEKHNYVKKISKMMAEGKLNVPMGQVSKMHITHDDWCSIFKDGYCDCNPDLEIELLQ